VQLTGTDVASFCHELVRRAGVLLLPGGLYGHGGNHFRIGFGRSNFQAALAALEQFLGSRND
jgi:aspartate/methionine/tyrosine aminotransferase